MGSYRVQCRGALAGAIRPASDPTAFRFRDSCTNETNERAPERGSDDG